MAKVDVMSDFHRLLNPRPVAFVCSINKEGKPNIMACSWITPVSEEPPLIALALWRKDYTHNLIEEVKEFTVNIPSANLLKQVWIAGTKSGRKVDKVSLTRLKLVSARKVRVPIIEECMGHLECRLTSFVRAGECNIYVGEVVEAYADESLFKKGVWTEDANILLHSGGKFFTMPKASFKVR
jgi:flavin reductase (DIM6/NTAB) family NADH-FMN oxidoreductase RutF